MEHARTDFASLSVRVAVWGFIFVVLFILRSFFLLLFLTFIFAYLQSHAVERLAPNIQRRSVRVVLVALVFLSVIVGIGFYIVPSVREQAQLFATNFGGYMARLDKEIVVLAENYPAFAAALGQDLEGTARELSTPNWNAGRSPTLRLVRQLSGHGALEDNNDHVAGLFIMLRNVGAQLVAAGSAFLLSLLFSFLIVFDLPGLTRLVTSLEHTKLRFAYHEVAGSICQFGQVLGRAFEAQFYIALLNTLLTAVGLVLIGLTEKMAFLLMIVFLCSFIPIAGVFISSVPICLLALQAGGPALAVLAALLITVIHLIEGYVLNPRIFGHHLRLNPVIVLIILTIGGKLFGVWGLVLGLPICTYIFKYAIQISSSQHPPAASASP